MRFLAFELAVLRDNVHLCYSLVMLTEADLICFLAKNSLKAEDSLSVLLSFFDYI